jgi:hypothetical protein
MPQVPHPLLGMPRSTGGFDLAPQSAFRDSDPEGNSPLLRDRWAWGRPRLCCDNDRRRLEAFVLLLIIAIADAH